MCVCVWLWGAGGGRGVPARRGISTVCSGLCFAPNPSLYIPFTHVLVNLGFCMSLTAQTIHHSPTCPCVRLCGLLTLVQNAVSQNTRRDTHSDTE